jgi:hypothetical protein
MNLLRTHRTLPALGLGLTLLFFATPSTFAQGPASGSGAGTGTGASAGSAGSTGTGTESGAGLGTTSGRAVRQGGGFDMEALPGRPGSPRIDPMLIPRIVQPGSAEGLFGKDEPPLVREALAISDPGERSLAMVRIARTSIFLGRPDLGHIAIFQAAKDSVLEPNDTLRDQRLVNVIQSALYLAEEHMREVALIQSGAEGGPVLPAPINTDRKSNLERGRQEWEMAYELSFAIKNRSARSETLYRVVESESLGSSSLVREPFRLAGGRPDPLKLPAITRDFSEGLLVSAIRHAQTIQRPIWRDRALVTIGTNAGASGQFARALDAARAIPQPEVRTDAMLKIAEDQVIFGRQNDATATYAEAAKAISEVPNTDPRETLVGVLIDSLIAFGRFDDARASTALYSNPANPPIALAAVAESQGRRNLADSARKWIEAETSPELRSLLYRKLNDGVLASIEQRRSAELSRP